MLLLCEKECNEIFKTQNDMWLENIFLYFFVSFLIILIKIRWKVEFAVNEENNTILYNLCFVGIIDGFLMIYHRKANK